MNNKTPSPEILAGVTAMLRPYYPELTATKLVDSIQQYDNTGKFAEKYLTQAEAAKKLNCSKLTIYRMIKDGTLPAKKVGKRLVRIPESALKVNKVGVLNDR